MALPASYWMLYLSVQTLWHYDGRMPKAQTPTDVHRMASCLGFRKWGGQCSSWANDRDFCLDQLRHIGDFLARQQQRLQAQQRAITDAGTAIAATRQQQADVVTAPAQQQQQAATADAVTSDSDDEEVTVVFDHQVLMSKRPAPTVSQTLQYNPGMMPEPVVLPSGDTLYPGETMAMP